MNIGYKSLHFVLFKLKGRKYNYKAVTALVEQGAWAKNIVVAQGKKGEKGGYLGLEC